MNTPILMMTDTIPISMLKNRQARTAEIPINLVFGRFKSQCDVCNNLNLIWQLSR